MAYLIRPKLPHEKESENAVIEQIQSSAKRVLYLGTGDGGLLALTKLKTPKVDIVALAFSEPMLQLASTWFRFLQILTIKKLLV